MRFGLAIAALAALAVLAPARSEAKKKNRDVMSSTMNLKMPAAAKAVKVKTVKFRVRDGIITSNQPMQMNARNTLIILPNGVVKPVKIRKSRSMRSTMKLPKNLKVKPVK